MLKKIQSNPKFKHFLLYCVTYIVYGGIITSLGPLIPYFSAYQNRLETEYSILFFSRAVGFVTMGIFMRVLQKQFCLHNLIIIGSVGGGICLSIFSYCTSILWKCFFLAMGSLFTCIFEIALNVSVLVAHSNNDQDFWLQLGHGMFGVGGLIGPFIVYMFQLHSYLIMGAGLVLAAPFYYVLKSPEESRHIDIEEIMSQRFSHNIQVFSHDQQKDGQKNIKESPEKHLRKSRKGHNIVGVPKSIQILVCLAFFLYIGLQTAFGGWVSSYAVLQNVSTKQEATFYSSIFWISITASRFLLAFIPGKISQKIDWSIYICFANLIASIILIQMKYYYIAVMMSSIVFGVGMATLFPLFFTIPGQFGMEFGVSQSANIMVFGAMGQAILSMVVGYLMGLFSPNMIFYGLFAMTVCIFITHKALMKTFRQNQAKDSKKDQPSYQLKVNFIQK